LADESRPASGATAAGPALAFLVPIGRLGKPHQDAGVAQDASSLRLPAPKRLTAPASVMLDRPAAHR